jgi:hypothetical protein
MVIVGGAVGTDDYIRKHIMDIVTSTLKKVAALTKLHSRQAANVMLVRCVIQALGYHMQVTSPRLAEPAVRAWDDGITEFRKVIMSDPVTGAVPEVGEDLQRLSDAKAQLPGRFGGLGHTSAVLLSPICYYAAYSHHASLDAGTRGRLLLPELEYCYDRLIRDTPLLEPLDFMEDSLILKPADLGTRKPIRKLQRDMTQQAHTAAFLRLKSMPMTDADKRVVENPTELRRVFRIIPFDSDHMLEEERYISALRFFLLLPQLLRFDPAEARIADAPVSDDGPDFSYQADACRQCSDSLCDRFLAHAHGCRTSSVSTIDGRHERVMRARLAMIKQAGYTDVSDEPRTDKENDQRRADIFYTDKLTPCKHVHYYTDDTIGHPLCKTHLARELKDSSHTLGLLVKNKEDAYKSKLATARLMPSVLQGYRVISFLACALTSLGDMSDGMMRCISAACGYVKVTARIAARRAPRADGRTPQALAKAFKQEFLDRIFLELARGNAMIALAVGH